MLFHPVQGGFQHLPYPESHRKVHTVLPPLAVLRSDARLQYIIHSVSVVKYVLRKCVHRHLSCSPAADLQRFSDLLQKPAPLPVFPDMPLHNFLRRHRFPACSVFWLFHDSHNFHKREMSTTSLLCNIRSSPALPLLQLLHQIWHYCQAHRHCIHQIFLLLLQQNQDHGK